MFVIRDAVWEKLAEAALADFVARVRIHLRKFFSEQCAALGEVKTGQLIEFGINRARRYGFKSEREVCKYIDLMCAFGHDFDRNARLPWARQILDSGFPPDPEERMQRLYQAAVEASQQLADAQTRATLA